MRIRCSVIVGVIVAMSLAPVFAQKGGSGGGTSSKTGGGGTTTGVVGPPELRVSNEVAAPGGLVQIKVSLTEPKPIMTGGFDFSGGFGEVAGIAAFSPQNDTTGLAWPTPNGIHISAVSTLSAFGTDPAGYPLLTLTVRVPANVPSGTVLPIHLDPASLVLLDPNGVPYVTKVTDGSVTVMAGTPAIENVTPGSDVVPAKGIVTLQGRNLSLDARIQISGVDIDKVLFVNTNRIDVIVKADAAMYAKEVRLRTRTSQSSYFAYQRTTPSTISWHNALKGMEPIFGTTTSSAAAVVFPARADQELQVLLVQNPHLESMSVTLSRTSQNGIEQAQVYLPAASRFALDLAEIFGSTVDAGSVVAISASSPVLAMGAVTDELLSNVRLIAGR